jgi:high frequency lysogenization protein
MSSKTDTDRTLAFAGILQALQLVQSSAYGRPYDADAFQASLKSILALDAGGVPEVYGGIRGVQKGLRLVQAQLMNDKHKPDVELTRYAITLLHLERKLSKRSDLLDRLRAGIEQAQHQVEHLGISHPNVLASFAETYRQTVSTLQPRIMVNGDPARLADTAIANQIRALLLAAMRSAVLWRQCRGTRLGLVFGRKKLAILARELQQNQSEEIH